ncbi:MAG: DUF87 domain-containing protein [Desulfobacterales bacterium]|nr:DUF87 domain-containing protein [Desulfobacterales bacterium]
MRTCRTATRWMTAHWPRVRLGAKRPVLTQSGSGKSFLVGRLIEELVIKTNARVVVLDPNSDFVRLPEVDEAA